MQQFNEVMIMLKEAYTTVGLAYIGAIFIVTAALAVI